MLRCRLCDSEKAIINLFSDSVPNQWREYILLATGVLIKEDDVVSKMVCKDCYDLVEKIYRYRTRVILYNKRLMGSLNNTEHSTPSARKGNASADLISQLHESVTQLYQQYPNIVLPKEVNRCDVAPNIPVVKFEPTDLNGEDPKLLSLRRSSVGHIIIKRVSNCGENYEVINCIDDNDFDNELIPAPPPISITKTENIKLSKLPKIPATARRKLARKKRRCHKITRRNYDRFEEVIPAKKKRLFYDKNGQSFDKLVIPQNHPTKIINEKLSSISLSPSSDSPSVVPQNLPTKIINKKRSFISLSPLSDSPSVAPQNLPTKVINKKRSSISLSPSSCSPSVVPQNLATKTIDEERSSISVPPSNDLPSVVSQNLPTKVIDEERSSISVSHLNGSPSMVPQNLPAMIINDEQASISVPLSSDSPSIVPQNLPTNIIDEVRSSISVSPPSDSPSVVPQNLPTNIIDEVRSFSSLSPSSDSPSVVPQNLPTKIVVEERYYISLSSSSHSPGIAAQNLPAQITNGKQSFISVSPSNGSPGIALQNLSTKIIDEVQSFISVSPSSNSPSIMPQNLPTKKRSSIRPSSSSDSPSIVAQNLPAKKIDEERFFINLSPSSDSPNIVQQNLSTKIVDEERSSISLSSSSDAPSIVAQNLPTKIIDKVRSSISLWSPSDAPSIVQKPMEKKKEPKATKRKSQVCIVKGVQNNRVGGKHKTTKTYPDVRSKDNLIQNEQVSFTNQNVLLRNDPSEQPEFISIEAFREQCPINLCINNETLDKAKDEAKTNFQDKIITELVQTEEVRKFQEPPQNKTTCVTAEHDKPAFTYITTQNVVSRSIIFPNSAATQPAEFKDTTVDTELYHEAASSQVGFRYSGALDKSNSNVFRRTINRSHPTANSMVSSQVQRPVALPIQTELNSALYETPYNVSQMHPVNTSRTLPPRNYSAMTPLQQNFSLGGNHGEFLPQCPQSATDCKPEALWQLPTMHAASMRTPYAQPTSYTNTRVNNTAQGTFNNQLPYSNAGTYGTIVYSPPTYDEALQYHKRKLQYIDRINYSVQERVARYEPY